MAGCRRKIQRGRPVIGKPGGELPPGIRGFTVQGHRQPIFNDPQPELLKRELNPPEWIYADRRHGHSDRRKKDRGRQARKRPPFSKERQKDESKQ